MARAVSVLLCFSLLFAAPAAAASSQASAAPRHARPAGHATAGLTPADLPPTYDLASAAGGVSSFGGAGYYGQASSFPLSAPVVGMAVTPDGHGYWLVGADGGIFTYGDAHFVGSTGAMRLNAPIVGMATTPDGHGYWLVASDGGIFAFGDAHFVGSTGAMRLNAPIVGMATTPDGHGYWLVASDGGIFTFGDAHFRGSTGAERLNAPIVGMAATDGSGYWLVARDGGVFVFGSGHFAGSAAGQLGTSTAAGIAATPDGEGYWIASSAGKVLAFGDAYFHGDVVETQLGTTTAAIVPATPVTVPPPSPYPAGSIGYDVNWPQCSGPTTTTTVTLPGPPDYTDGTRPYTVAVVGVDGWAVDDTNPCLAAEAKWAAAAVGGGGASYDLYMLLNAPASTSTTDWTGPAGDCHTMTAGSTAAEDCLAYNYGWNDAQIADAYAKQQGATAQVWWLDIENTSCSGSNFNGGPGAPWSCTTALNDLTLQGAMDALHEVGITVGVYSTWVQWGEIMGDYVPREGTLGSVPLWVAGAPWTTPPFPSGYESESALAPYCDGSYDFAGGTPWLLQETPGSTNYPFDPDYACGGEPVGIRSSRR